MTRTMEGVKVGTITVQKQALPFYVDDAGTFRVKVGEEDISADTKADLEKKASRAISVQRVQYAIPVILHIGGRGLFGRGAGEYVRALLRGQNARTRAWLVQFDNGKKDSLEHPVIAARGEWVSDAQLAELNRLAAAASAAAEAQHEYLQGLIPMLPDEFRSKHRQRVEVPPAWSLIKEAQEQALAKEAGDGAA